MLNDLAEGQDAARNDLLQCVLEHLRAIARHRLASERPGHTLQATALVNEAYLRLVGDVALPWRDRAHFYGAAAEAMRRILVDHARRRDAQKRGGDRQRVPLSICDLASLDDPEQILALDRALLRLEEIDADAAQVVRLRFFAGLTNEQAAAALDVSERTVKREWTFARATLFRLLREELADRSSG
jgi:RNA polymerase sigma factor (TIGR02999 family)